MSLITRTAKGSKLTIAEMDGNLTYLESNGFVDGEYSQTQIGTGAVLSMEAQLTPDATIGVYEGISPTGGSGAGLIVDVEISDFGKGLGATYTIIDGGSGYQVGDTVSIQNTDIGGTSGTTDRDLYDGNVDTTTSSTISVTNTNITLDTTTLTISGSVRFNDPITAVNKLTAASGMYATGISADTIFGYGLSINNPSALTNINFSNLPTTDPEVPGQLWVDTANGHVLKVSPVVPTTLK